MSIEIDGLGYYYRSRPALNGVSLAVRPGGVVGLLGANGAGKSNLFKALRYLKSAALKPRKKNSGTGRKPFRFAGKQDAPSSFDLQFIA